MRTGIILAIFAYLFWGLMPIYWKSIRNVPALEILCHRIIWSFLFLVILQTFGRQWRLFLLNLKNPKTRRLYFGSACIIAFNWGLYIWAVNAGFIVEASLGYFINPLVSVLLGVVFLKERLRRVQWVAVIIAASGVLFMTIQYGVFPWIALLLAGTFTGVLTSLPKSGEWMVKVKKAFGWVMIAIGEYFLVKAGGMLI